MDQLQSVRLRHNKKADIIDDFKKMEDLHRGRSGNDNRTQDRGMHALEIHPQFIKAIYPIYYYLYVHIV